MDETACDMSVSPSETMDTTPDTPPSTDPAPAMTKVDLENIKNLEKDEHGTPLMVSCGTNKAVLYLEKLEQGSKGASVLFDTWWLTPNEFQKVSGRGTAKDWKRSIKHNGRSLKLLIARGLLFLNPPQCKCEMCTGIPEDPPITGSKKASNGGSVSGNIGSGKGSNKKKNMATPAANNNNNIIVGGESAMQQGVAGFHENGGVDGVNMESAAKDQEANKSTPGQCVEGQIDEQTGAANDMRGANNTTLGVSPPALKHMISTELTMPTTGCGGALALSINAPQTSPALPMQKLSVSAAADTKAMALQISSPPPTKNDDNASLLVKQVNGENAAAAEAMTKSSVGGNVGSISIAGGGKNEASLLMTTSATTANGLCSLLANSCTDKSSTGNACQVDESKIPACDASDASMTYSGAATVISPVASVSSPIVSLCSSENMSRDVAAHLLSLAAAATTGSPAAAQGGNGCHGDKMGDVALATPKQLTSQVGGSPCQQSPLGGHNSSIIAQSGEEFNVSTRYSVSPSLPSDANTMAATTGVDEKYELIKTTTTVDKSSMREGGGGGASHDGIQQGGEGDPDNNKPTAALHATPYVTTPALSSSSSSSSSSSANEQTEKEQGETGGAKTHKGRDADAETNRSIESGEVKMAPNSEKAVNASPLAQQPDQVTAQGQKVTASLLSAGASSPLDTVAAPLVVHGLTASCHGDGVTETGENITGDEEASPKKEERLISIIQGLKHYKRCLEDKLKEHSFKSPQDSVAQQCTRMLGINQSLVSENALFQNTAMAASPKSVNASTMVSILGTKTVSTPESIVTHTDSVISPRFTTSQSKGTVHWGSPPVQSQTNSKTTPAGKTKEKNTKKVHNTISKSKLHAQRSLLLSKLSSQLKSQDSNKNQAQQPKVTASQPKASSQITKTAVSTTASKMNDYFHQMAERVGGPEAMSLYYSMLSLSPEVVASYQKLQEMKATKQAKAKATSLESDTMYDETGALDLSVKRRKPSNSKSELAKRLRTTMDYYPVDENGALDLRLK